MSKFTAAVGMALAQVTLTLGQRTLPDCSSGLLASNSICDTTATPAERAAALVSAMNTEEKLANLVRSVQADTPHSKTFTYSIQ